MADHYASGNSASGDLNNVDLQLLASERMVRATFTGTYTGAQGKLQGSHDGTTYVDLTGMREDTGAFVTGTIDLGGTNCSIILNCAGWRNVRWKPSQVSTGTLATRVTGGSTFELPLGATALSVGSVAATITSTSANAFAVGANGTTNPVLKVDASTASVATGLSLTGAAEAGGVALAVISSGADESLSIDAKGAGEIGLNATGTGDIVLNRATRLPDAIDLMFGTGEDAKIRWSTGDADNHTLVVAVDNTNQSLHVTDVGAIATDWNIAATTDPNLYIHSNTTPATDYLRLGDHTGTAADIDVVGGTTLNFQIGGATSACIISGNFFVGDTANANSTIGLTINQAGNDDNILTLKSSDISHGLTTIVPGSVEDDDFLTVQKFAAATGGATIIAAGENAAVTTNLLLFSVGGQADTTHSAAGRGLVEVYASQHDGANALSDIAADGNAFAVRGRRGTADATLFIVDEDGEIHSDVTLNVFDEHDDAALCRSLDTLEGTRGAIQTRWDGYVRSNEETLVRLGILGAPLNRGGLMNHNKLLKLHNGAIWQTACDLMEIARVLPEEARAQLPARMRERLALAG